MTVPIDDDFTEITDAEFDRVDLVGKAANGLSFLISKSAADGTAVTVEDAPALRSLDQMTISGTPAQIAAMIASAPIRKSTTDAQEGTMTATPAAVAKADEDLDPTEPLAPSTGPTDESAPGSPDWEQLDADSAMKWTAILARAKNALEMLAGREMQESASGEDDGRENSWDLEDAATAIDCAIGILAGYAVGEQAEAELAVAVGKAAAGVDLDALSALEGFGSVAKAGRTLSAANEATIRGAVDSLQKVLASLPAPAPEAAEVAKEKENTVTEPTTIVGERGPELVASIDDRAITKAKGDPQVAVYDADGTLVGTIDQADLNPIAAAAPPEGGDADKAAEQPPADTTPAPADNAGIPASVPVTAPPVPAAVTKSDVENLIKEALDAKEAEQASVIKGLEDEIAMLKSPATPKVLTNGALPPAHQMRGQDAGAPPAVNGVELRKQLADSLDAGEQKRLHDQMQSLAVAKISELHNRG
jgi:hypothetical protein